MNKKRARFCSEPGLEGQSGRKQSRRYDWLLLGSMVLLAPFGLGAKGCDIAIVGDDCAPGSTDPKCTGTDGGASKVCGGLAALACGEGEFCDYPITAQCGAADQTGVCKSIPEACTLEYSPVCGCDDKTYGNACSAALAGVSVQAKGECSPATGVACGGPKKLTCGDGQYCSYSVGQCGAPDQTGTCTALPTGCTKIYDPVCGCDGKTYGNECVAATAGVSVRATGVCETSGNTVCGGLRGLQCEKGQYCSYPIEAKCGAADQTGVCTSAPTACDAVLDPVCGCDGKTYDNECVAARAGISVASKGKCAATPVLVCGGLTGSSCGKGEYCNYPPEAKCGAGDMTGRCTAVPTECPTIYTPVCGCDGKTYGNDCEAARAGVSVQVKGECSASDGAACGGLKGLVCAKGQYCHYAPDAQCGAADQTGICKSLPTACTANFDPVCGCDGKTYGNECSAALAGVSVASKGECVSQGTVCGGLKGTTCAKGQFCDYGSSCGASDQTGTCTTIPEGCTAEYAPVCGCDGKTYGNACTAMQAGVSIASKGECATSTPKACGARLGNTCAADQYCLFPDRAVCGRADGTGVCTAKPTVCTADINPVCGCDGNTYANKCAAAVAGISVDPESLCESSTLGKSCGGFTAGPIPGCSQGEYCAYTLEAQCGAADQPGVCTAIPTGGCITLYDPVCGCDGKTYGNDCEAARGGASVAYKGVCK